MAKEVAPQVNGLGRTINSKRKGSRGELDAAKALGKVLGWSCHRRLQYNGRAGDDDVATGITGLHCEVKYTQDVRVNAWFNQCQGKCRDEDTPFVMHRMNMRCWLVMWLRSCREQFLDLVKANTKRPEDLRAVVGAIGPVYRKRLLTLVGTHRGNMYKAVGRTDKFGIGVTFLSPDEKYLVDMTKLTSLAFLAHAED